MEVSDPVVKPPKSNAVNLAEIHALLLAPIIQRCICFVATAGIPDLLADHPQSAKDLANKTKLHEPSLFRVLRALAGAGMFRLNEEDKFEMTPMAEVFRSDVPNSLRDFAIFIGSERIWNGWGGLAKTVATGITAQKLIYGKELFEHLDEHPDEAAVFNRAMTANTVRSIPSILDAYDFSDIKTLVDVGGGAGMLLAKILKAYPQMNGILFELQSVAETAGATFSKEGVTDRVNITAGDFFKQSPPSADAYILKFIIHDWDEEAAIIILKNIASAMHKNSKLLILESVMPEGNEPSLTKLRDLQMMLLPGGKERTEKEYHQLLSMAGLKLIKIHPTKSFLDIIEIELS
jgi:hypothetical protein